MSNDVIPVFTPAPDVERHWEQLRAASESVIRSGAYILGPEEKAFEHEAARDRDATGRAHAAAASHNKRHGSKRTA